MRFHVHKKCLSMPVIIAGEEVERWCPKCRTDLHYSDLVTVSDDIEDPLYSFEPRGRFSWVNPNPAVEI